MNPIYGKINVLTFYNVSNNWREKWKIRVQLQFFNGFSYVLGIFVLNFSFPCDGLFLSSSNIDVSTVSNSPLGQRLFLRVAKSKKHLPLLYFRVVRSEAFLSKPQMCEVHSCQVCCCNILGTIAWSDSWQKRRRWWCAVTCRLDSWQLCTGAYKEVFYYYCLCCAN